MVLKWFGCGAGSDLGSARSSLEEACCHRLSSLAEVLGVGVACSLKGPLAEHIIKLLVTMYRLLKSVTLLAKAPQSESSLQYMHTGTHVKRKRRRKGPGGD